MRFLAVALLAASASAVIKVGDTLPSVTLDLGFPPEKVMNIIGEYGNCIAASIPMTLAQAERQGRLTRGSRVLFLGTGAGLHVAGAVVRW